MSLLTDPGILAPSGRLCSSGSGRIQLRAVVVAAGAPPVVPRRDSTPVAVCGLGMPQCAKLASLQSWPRKAADAKWFAQSMADPRLAPDVGSRLRPALRLKRQGQQARAVS